MVEFMVEFMLNPLAETTNTTHLRLLGLEQVLEQKGVLTDPEVAARMQAISDAAEPKLEYGDDPEVERFRQLRRSIKDRRDAQPPDGAES